MNPKKNNELISLIIISYNQENYIEEAILSAFNQDYDNYEIIISDDCSTDNTWEIINETIKNKSHTNSVEIILNKNEKNLGIVRNYQKAICLSKGNWIVASAGDDISKPNRLKVINELSNSEKNIFAIGTGFDLINRKGGYLSKNNPCIQNEINLPLYPGFSAAINRNTFTKFPVIKENIQSEDIIYTLRALELGKIILANISTVKHRIHSNNVTSKGTSLEAYQGKILNHRNAIKTLDYYRSNELRNKNLIPIINRQIKIFEEKIDNYNYIITYYKMSFVKKLLNISKLKIIVNNKKYFTSLYKIKIFCESFKILSFLVNLTENIYFPLTKIKRKIWSKKIDLSKIKCYKI